MCIFIGVEGSNNAAVLTQQRFIFAAIGDESKACTDTFEEGKKINLDFQYHYPLKNISLECTKKFYKRKKYTGVTLIKKTRAKNVKVCLNKCLSNEETCVAVNWRKKACYLLSSYTKIVKKKGWNAGKCV